MKNRSFKECPSCGQAFSMQDILVDPTVRPLGMTFEDSDLETSLYFFAHAVPECGTTFLIPAVRFIEAIDEPIPEKIRTGQPGCEDRCSNLSDWLECKNDCFHAPFRRLMIRMIELKKTSQPTS